MDDFDAHNRSGLDLGGDHYAHREYRLPDGKIIAYAAGATIPEGAVFIGIHEHHLKPDGSWCGGWVGFSNVEDPGRADGTIEPYRIEGTHHTLDKADPLTISPSLACRSCPSHGWIKEGVWSDA